jgi:hypothetical protein|tara:strand:+ start:784 stop:1041 length:258 start_codon:yes stop_codon:yes gene_type:complete
MSQYDLTKNQLIVSNIGRKLMDISVNTPMKGLDAEGIARTNRMSTFGDTLTRFGAPWGPRNLSEVLKTSGIGEKEAAEFMQLGNS